MSDEERNYYQILGVSRDATESQITAAFLRAQAQQASLSTVDPEYIAYAYQVLRDPRRRQLYDQLLGQLEAALQVQVQASATELPILDGPQVVYLLIELQPGSQGDQARLPLNLCLVVDRSTSMRGERLSRVQSSLHLLLSQLSEGDVLALVSFSDRAELLLPAAPVAMQRGAGERIDALEASGGTEIFQGLLAGIAQLRLNSGPEVNSHLILLTDGRTYGDEQQCLQLAAATAAEGITIHAFGLGSDWDDQFLDKLVSPSGGLVEYIAASEDIVTALSERLQGLGETVARDVRFRTVLPPAVELQDAFRLTPYAQPLLVDTPVIALGNVNSRSPLKFLLVLRIRPLPIPMRIGIPLSFTANFPGVEEQLFTQNVDLIFSESAPPLAVPPAVLQAARLFTICRLADHAWEEAESGQLESAASHMQHLSTRLLELGQPALAKQAAIEAQQLAVTGELSEERRKQLKYGTRALTGQSLPLGWNEPL